jgi:hypothetical protein
LKAGVFYGTNFLIGQENGILPAIENDGIPLALVQGNRDSVATPSNAELTYARIQDPPKAFIPDTLYLSTRRRVLANGVMRNL